MNIQIFDDRIPFILRDTIFNNTVNCNSITAQGVAQFVTAAMTSFGFKNPYVSVGAANINAV